jgi:hypothetical protein
MRKSKRAPKAGFLSQTSLIEVKRRSKLICDALDSENDEKVEIICVESIKIMSPEELVVLAGLIENHGFFAVADALATSNSDFFSVDSDAED